MTQSDRANRMSFFGFMLSVNFILLLSAFLIKDAELSNNLQKILTINSSLTTDFFAIGGFSATLLNVSLVGFLSLAVLWFSKSEPSGLGLMAYMIMLGFSFFGKTALNSLPLIMGVWLYSRSHKLPFKQFSAVALFACSLTPIVTMIAFSSRHLTLALPLRLVLAVIIGAFIGYLVPIISKHTPNMHKGMNIYNVGLSGGLIAWMFFTLYRSLVLSPMGLANESIVQSYLSSGYPMEISMIFSLVFLSAFGWSLYASRNIKDAPGSYRQLLRRSGHQSDFVKTDGMAATLANMTTIGFAGLLYYHLVKAPFTGPTVGALLAMVCLSANGVSLVNAWPSVAGYALASLLMPWSLGTQVIAVTVSFSLALSPISGVYGWYWGVVAGFLHASLAPYATAIHGGLTLYNGGFSAGLVALFMFPILDAYKLKKNP
jgi:hypothetical protein